MHRSPKPLRRLLAATACALALALALAACGDDEEPTTSTPTTTSTTTAPPPEQAEVSRLRADFNRQIETVLATQYELTPEQTDCAIARLNATVDEAEVKRAVKTGEPSQEFLEAAFTAGEECGGGE